MKLRRTRARDKAGRGTKGKRDKSFGRGGGAKKRGERTMKARRKSGEREHGERKGSESAGRPGGGGRKRSFPCGASPPAVPGRGKTRRRGDPEEKIVFAHEKTIFHKSGQRY